MPSDAIGLRPVNNTAGGDLIMCGEGHKDWVAGIDFHPSGAGLASGSGDASVKLWSFEKQR